MSSRLMDGMCDVMRRRHCSTHAERTYCDWVTVIYTRVLQQDGKGVMNPLDELDLDCQLQLLSPNSSGPFVKSAPASLVPRLVPSERNIDPAAAGPMGIVRSGAPRGPNCHQFGYKRRLHERLFLRNPG